MNEREINTKQILIGAPADEWGERGAENQAYLVLTIPLAIEIMAVLRSFLPLS